MDSGAVVLRRNTIMENPNCTCKKKRCPRHGKCDECRAHHASLKGELPVACERKKK